MSFNLRSIVDDLREVKNAIWRRDRTRSYVAPDVVAVEEVEQGEWASFPGELLMDVIRRVEESETVFPARTVVVACAGVCKWWREITKQAVGTLEECGRLTFPISLKQPAPRDAPIQCYIRRDRATSSFRLYFGLVPSEDESDKLLLAAKKIRRATSTDFVISLVADNFSRTSNTYVGKLRSNFLGTKFTIYDTQPSTDAAVKPCSRLKTVNIATISYELNVLRTRGPRRMNCVMNSIPLSSIQEGGVAPTPTLFPDKSPISPVSKDLSPKVSKDPLVLKNKAPRWHEQLQCWCLNFKGRVTVASVKNFQLSAAGEQSHNVSAEEKEKVTLQFGKIGKDIFTMDYRYPLSAFQAFAICLTSFDTKPACE